MRNWRVLTAIVAVIFGIMAAVGSYYYLNKADERASDKLELVKVLVAKDSIPKGTTGIDAINRGLVGLQEIVERDRPASARTSADPIKLLVAAATIDKGVVITESAFVTASSLGGSLSNTIDNANKAKWNQAISISVDLPHGVAGLIVPNDTVNLLTTAKIKDPANKGEAAESDVTTYVLSGLKVLAVGTTTAVPAAPAPTTGPDGNPTTATTQPPNQQQQNVGLITLEVTPRQAQQIAHNQAAGWPIYLTLNPNGFNQNDVKLPVEIVEAYNFFDQDLTILRQWQALVPKE